MGLAFVPVTVTCLVWYEFCVESELGLDLACKFTHVVFATFLFEATNGYSFLFTTNTVTVNVNTLSTVLAAAIHQAVGSSSTRDCPGGSSQAPFSTAAEEPSGSGTASNDQ